MTQDLGENPYVYKQRRQISISKCEITKYNMTQQINQTSKFLLHQTDIQNKLQKRYFIKMTKKIAIFSKFGNKRIPTNKK